MSIGLDPFSLDRMACLVYNSTNAKCFGVNFGGSLGQYFQADITTRGQIANAPSIDLGQNVTTITGIQQRKLQFPHIQPTALFHCRKRSRMAMK
jgi:hypothetical protein